MSWIAAAVVGGAAIGLIGSSMQAGAASDAASQQYQATTQGQQQQLEMFNRLNQQNLPFRSAGYSSLNTLQSMLPGQYTQYDAEGKPIGTATGSGYLTSAYPEYKTFTKADLYNNLSPSYEFMKNQGLGAIRQNVNVGGGGSNSNLAATKFAEDYASTNYQNALNNYMAQQGQGFNQYQTQTGNIFNRLSAVAGLGQASQQQANTLGSNTANAISQLGVAGGNALAGGTMGSANAYASGIGNVGQSVGNAAIMYKLLNA